MHTENADYFLQHLDESFDTYLKKTKRAFSGENTEVQFYLEDDTFTWKQQTILTRGEITVHPLSNILIISDTLKQILERYQGCQEHMVVLEEENKYLNETNTKLATDKEKVEKIKEATEKDLFTKFLLLLNSKKQKIRELQEALNKQAKSVYDETTDASEGSDIEDKKVQETSIKSDNIKKRKANCRNEQKDWPKTSKRDLAKCRNYSSSESSSPEPSTSKDKPMLQNVDVQHVTRVTKQLLSTLEKESDDDLFSQ